MVRSVSRLAFVLVIAAATAEAQQVPAGVAGKWEGKAMIGPKDSVIATSVTTATATTKGWTIQFPNRPPQQARVLAAGGDVVKGKFAGTRAAK